MSPDSLVARVLKAIYYPSSNFLQATVGSQASYVWRSIVRGRELLESGIRWRVGNGSSIKVWQDKWIPQPFGFKVVSPNLFFGEDLLVEDLIDKGLSQWRVELLEVLFSPRDTEMILQIPLCSSWPADEIVWHYSRDGSFSVKTAYHLARTLEDLRSSQVGVSTASSATNWTKIWGLEVPPKVQHFVWRLVSGILPVRRNLCRRIMLPNAKCCWCLAEVEDEVHVFKDCAFA